jgi:hypothetical protein
MVGMLVGDMLVHGWDIATAIGGTWAVDRLDACLSFAATMPVVPYFEPASAKVAMTRGQWAAAAWDLLGPLGLLRLLEPSVRLEDVLVRGTFVRYVRVMVTAQDVRSALEGVMADSPASLAVAVDLADTRVHAEADRRDECRLSEVGTKPGPEVVIEVRPSMEGASVQREPMPYRVKERDEKGKPDDANYQQQDNGDSLGETRTAWVGAGCGRFSLSRLIRRGSR